MNIEKIITQLVNKQNEVTDPMDFALIGKAIEKLKTTQVFFVNYVGGLPVATTVSEGTLYYVRNEKALYYSDSSRWLNLSYLNKSSLYTFGANTSGALASFGTDLGRDRCSPLRIYSDITDWTSVIGGNNSFRALRPNGTLWSWGSNSQGELGDGTTVNKCSPVSVIGGFTNWCQVSAGDLHTVALRADSTAWAWGFNNCGQLGDGTTVTKSSPVSVLAVAGASDEWYRVSSGRRFTVAIELVHIGDDSGPLWAWGINDSGQLGDNSIVNKCSPVSVVGGFSNWCQVSAGRIHVAAVRKNGTLWAWGYNGGRLGDGTTVAKSSPVSVVGGFTDWCQVSAGYAHTAAVRTNGTLWTWGSGLVGSLGDGTTACKSSPVSVVGGFTDWCQVSASRGYHNLALRTNGTLWAWGCNGAGRLGDETTTNRSSPVSVVGGFSDWCSIGTGSYTFAAIRRFN